MVDAVTLVLVDSLIDGGQASDGTGQTDQGVAAGQAGFLLDGPGDNVATNLRADCDLSAPWVGPTRRKRSVRRTQPMSSDR